MPCLRFANVCVAWPARGASQLAARYDKIRGGLSSMCRNIKTLANFEPPATDDEIRASALQFVRKLSGSTRPSRANEAAFDQAIEEVTTAARKLIHSLKTSAPPKSRDEEARKAKERSLQRFA
jgi:hypothetical protein